jgi:hypothetical protein
VSVVSIKAVTGKSGEFGLLTESRGTRKWRVITNNRQDDENVILNYAHSTQGSDGQYLLPRPYLDTHPTNPAFLCRRVNIDQDTDNPLVWVATATYSAAPVSELQLSTQEAPNPLLRRAEFAWSTTFYQQAVDQDLDGDAIVNSAGDPYDPPVEIQRSRFVCTISKNVIGIPSWALQYENAVNNDNFSIDGLQVPQYVARLSGIGLSSLKREKIATGIEFEYRVFTCKIELNAQKWHPLRVLDIGYRKKDGQERKPFTEKTVAGVDRVVTTPVLMNGQGDKLVPPLRTNAVYNDFKVYPLLPFNNIIPLI